MNEVFLDAAHVIALASVTDQYHGVARRWQGHLEQRGARFLTTQAVLLEVENALAGRRFRRGFVAAMGSLKRQSAVEVVLLTPRLFDQGLALFRERPDKDWGLVDCISFVVMRERGLGDALTADAHFQQAGFRALLLERSA